MLFFRKSWPLKTMDFSLFVCFCLFKSKATVFSVCLAIQVLKIGCGRQVAVSHLLFSAFMNDDFPQIEFIQRGAERNGNNSFHRETAVLYCLSLIVSALTHAGDNALS